MHTNEYAGTHQNKRTCVRLMCMCVRVCMCVDAERDERGKGCGNDGRESAARTMRKIVMDLPASATAKHAENNAIVVNNIASWCAELTCFDPRNFRTRQLKKKRQILPINEVQCTRLRRRRAVKNDAPTLT